MFLPHQGQAPLYRVLAERDATGFSELAPAVTRMARVLDGAVGAGPWFSGEGQRTRITLDERSIAAYLESVSRARDRGIPEVCCLSSSRRRGPSTLFLELEPVGTNRNIASAWFAVPQLPPVEEAMQLVCDFATAFGAAHAYLEDARLLIRYVSRRAFERASSNTPPDLRRYLPEPELPSAELALPDLFVDFDRIRIPVGVFWVNYFGVIQVRALGEERVRGAGWARVVDASNGALVLAATEQPLDPNHPPHVRRLREIIDHLGLVEAQRAARLDA